MTLRALLYGEALIDCYPDERVVAGAPLHVACHLAHRGWKAALVSRVGDDEDGRAIRAVLDEQGVDTSLLEQDDELPTGTVTIEPGDGKRPGFTIHRPAAWDAIEGPETWPDHEAVVYGTLAARDDRSRATLERLLGEPTTLRVFDVNLRPPDVSDEVVRHGLRAAHLVKVNDDELHEVVDRLGLTHEPASWFEDNPHLEWLCITHGPQGAELFRRDDWSDRCPGADVEIVDTVGAGDAFTAGLVNAVGRGLAPHMVLGHASELAASVLTRRGGLPAA